MSLLVDKMYFKFPVRIYQISNREIAVKIKEALERGEEASIDDMEDEDEEFGWAMGWRRIPYELIKNLSWCDHNYKKADPKELTQKGFDSTLLQLDTGESVPTMWARKEFEDRLEKYLNSYQEQFGSLSK